MRFYRFNLLSPRAQLLCVMLTGTYLGERWEGLAGIKLYHVSDEGRGFFAEVGLDKARGRFVVLHSFEDTKPLMRYVSYMQLPSS